MNQEDIKACLICNRNKDKIVIQKHHVHYFSKNEEEDDFLILCSGCHKRLHDSLPEIKKRITKRIWGIYDVEVLNRVSKILEIYHIRKAVKEEKEFIKEFRDNEREQEEYEKKCLEDCEDFKDDDWE